VLMCLRSVVPDHDYRDAVLEAEVTRRSAAGGGSTPAVAPAWDSNVGH
jgi:hypothetical protein